VAGKPSIAILFGADIIRSSEAAECTSAIANLALLTGCIGKEAGGLFPVDAKNNSQGLLDLGVAPDSSPGYGAVAAPGKDLGQIIAGIESGAIKALYVLGADLSMFPGNTSIMQALARLDLLIVQDIFATRVVECAHVVLPGAAAAEKSGSFTSTDNRVQCFSRSVPPPGDAREDWDILTELSNRLAFQAASATPAGILAEIKEATALYGGECRMADGRCTGTVKTTAVLKSGAAFAPVSAAQARTADGLKLLVSAVGFHNGTMSTRSENNLSVSSEGYLEIHPEDASRLGVAAGDALKVSSSAGSITGSARISARLQPGLMFAPCHFRELNANALLSGAVNLVSVKVEKG
jgi:formate dehydrogenase alpha subunit